MSRSCLWGLLVLVAGCGTITSAGGTGGEAGASASGGAGGQATGSGGREASGGVAGSSASGSGGTGAGGSSGGTSAGGSSGGKVGGGGAGGITVTGAGGGTGGQAGAGTGHGGAGGATVTGAGGAAALVTLTLVVQDDDACQADFTASGTAAPNNMTACTISNATATKFETTCTYKFAPGTSVTVDAKPQGGSRFDGPPALDCGNGITESGDCVTGDCSCTFTITTSKMVTASFCHT